MDMVGHPDIAMDRQTMGGGSRDQGVAKKLVVRIGSKDSLPIIAALNDVLRLTWNNEARETRHVTYSRGTVYTA
jgi:hypothetical protein